MAQELNFDITQVDPTNFESQGYGSSDTTLLTEVEVSYTFNPTTDYIDYFIYNGNGNLIQSFEGGSYNNYRIYDGKVSIDPQDDITVYLQNDLQDGAYYTVYNFSTNLLASSQFNNYYISEISADRTEIRLDTTAISNSDVIASANSLASLILNSSYYYDFYINFGNNELAIANNLLLDTTDLTNPTILVKLYDPLPEQYDIKSTLWVVNKVAEPVAFSIQLTSTFTDVGLGQPIKGPNFNLELPNLQGNQTTTFNLTSLLQAKTTTGSQSLTYQLNSILQEKGIELNIDYSDYQNFVHFSSAESRLENFYYKLSLIEEYTVSSSVGNNLNSYTSASRNIWQSKIDEIITNFDGYEYYLYYTSASTAWPKYTNQPPYGNYSVSASQAITWFTNQLTSASNYDALNYHALTYAIPSYLREDPTNSQFELFVEMIGQHFDVLWTYTQQVPRKYDADNRLDYGISKDLVADVLRDFGIKIYQNNFSTQNLYSALIGITPSGSLLNIPNTTLTLPAGTGLEYINTFITASPTSSLVPLDDANKEIYKRIFHNLPYLLKKKGTTAGLRALINIYGIPDTILRINEFGGKDKTNTNDWDNWQDTFNYALSSKASGGESIYGIAPWRDLTTTNKTPQTIEFRFKTTEFPPTYYTSSLAVFVSSSGQYLSQGFILEYTGSGLTSASYSGSIPSSSYQYATLKYVSQSISTSVYLPFYNGDWWSVGLTLQSASNGYTASLYAKQKGTNIGDNYIKYKGSSSVILKNVPSASSFLYIPVGDPGLTPFTYGGGKIATGIFSASFQELRYYSTPISESVFDDFVMNPYSIEGNNLQGADSAYNTLLYRIDLGSNLNISQSNSIIISSSHPSVTGSTPTQSFSGNIAGTYLVQFFGLDESLIVYNENQEFIYQDQPNAGIKIPISDKIKIGSQILPTGNTLSPYISIQQDLPISSSYTKDINYIEVGFSPQDEINDDIQAQFGFFNYGEYIGDPRFQSSSATSYPDLNTLRDQYFQKYYKNNNIFDYVRLIKYFDNSLFKMIKDFTPARAGLATGVIVKQHILEKNRYRAPQVDWEDQQYTGSVGSLSTGYATGSKVYTFTGGTGGSLPTLTTITGSGLDSTISQSWSETVLTPLGSNTIIHDNLEEFYNGQFEGTVITITTGSLIDSDCQQFLDVSTAETNYKPVLYRYQTTDQTTFLNYANPANGEILMFFTSEQFQQGSPEFRNTNNQVQNNTQ